MIVLGIDIGITGAIAAVDQHSATVEDLPVQRVAGKRQVQREIDPRSLMMLIRQMVRPGYPALAVMEDVHAGIGPGSTARASLMDSKGAIRAVLAIAQIPVHIVQPTVWKRHHGLIKQPKDASGEKARELFPEQMQRLKRKKDHNRAEALLLARFGMETLT